MAAAERLLKVEMAKNLQILRDLELMPEFAGQNWSGVALANQVRPITGQW